MATCDMCHEDIILVSGQGWKHEDKGQLHKATVKARPNSNYILQVMRDGDISYDPWGTAMSWAFACAESLAVVRAEVPSELGYQPSPFVAVQSEDDYTPESYEDEVVWEYLGYNTGLTLSRVKDVQFAAKCLSRYLDWCRAAGRDY